MKKNSKAHFKKVDNKILSILFNSNLKNIDKFCGNISNKYNLNYLYLKHQEKKNLYKECLYYIEKDKQKIAAKYRKMFGKRVGQRILRILKKKLKRNLIPKYYTKKNFGIFRLGGKFIKSKNKILKLKCLKFTGSGF